MSALYVRLFGRFEARRSEQMLDGFESGKAREIFSYLLVRRDHPQTRDDLVDALWAGCPQCQGRKHLRQTLWQVNAALGAGNSNSKEPILLIDADWVHVNPRADLWLDIAEFENAFKNTHGVLGRALDRPRMETLSSAAALVRGELLEGCYQDWCLLERERLHNLYLAGLDKLMDYCEAHEDFEAALSYGNQVLRHEQARESTHRRMMRLYFRAGDRVAALRQYERCVKTLRRELAVEPAPSTVALYEVIRNGHLNNPESGSHTIDALKHIQSILADVQAELQREVRSLELHQDQ